MSTVPNFVPPEFVKLWQQPWTIAARSNPEFRRLLQVHGYLTPNFSLREARCNDAAHTPCSSQAYSQGARPRFQYGAPASQARGSSYPYQFLVSGLLSTTMM
jgi:hypothetical protein